MTRSSLTRAVFTLFCSAGILFLFFAIRVHVLGVYDDNRSRFETRARTEFAVEDAERFFSGTGFRALFREGATSDDQGFALVVAGAWLVTGKHTIDSISYLNFGLDFLALLALCSSVWRVFGRLPGLLVGFLYAAYVPIAVEICVANVLIYQVHAAVFLVWFLTWFPRRLWSQVASTLIVGLLSVLASMIRGTFALFPIALAFHLFLREGRKRGVLLALVLLAVSLGGLGFVKKVLRNPTHPVSHNLFIGLGDFPNPWGITTIDSRGWDEARNLQKGVQLYSPEYLEILRARTLTLVDEAPGYYLRLVAKRIWRVLFAEQSNWWFFGFGADRGQRSILAWAIFLLFLAGLRVAYANKIHDSSLYLLAFLYFGFIVVPIITSHPDYYLTASVMQLPFAALALSRLRLSVRARPVGDQVGEEKTRPAWAISPCNKVFVRMAAAAGCAGIVAAFVLFLAYARMESKSWREAFLTRVEGYEVVEKWHHSPPSDSGYGSSHPITTPVPVQKGSPYLFHTVLQVERGRLGLQAFDDSGKSLSAITYSSSPGRIHCFTGWFAPNDRSVALHVWDALPCGPTLMDDERQTQTVLEAYNHYRIADHAKFEFFPGNRVEVSSTLFPNGHQDMPFKVDKLRWDKNEPIKIPAYWAANTPCSATLDLAQDPEVSQLLLTNRKGELKTPKILVRTPGSLLFQTLPVESIERGSQGKALRFFFPPVRVSAMAIRFDEAPDDSGVASLTDFSLPDSARFEVIRTTLYRIPPEALSLPVDPKTGQKPPPTEGFPQSLSFLDPETHP